jgi:hypothetical protein
MHHVERLVGHTTSDRFGGQAADSKATKHW